MTKDELIIKQQMQIEEMSALIKSYKSIKKRLHLRFYSIGAPLNDNLLKFNNDQLRWAAETVEIINEL